MIVELAQELLMFISLGFLGIHNELTIKVQGRLRQVIIQAVILGNDKLDVQMYTSGDLGELWEYLPEALAFAVSDKSGPDLTLPKLL